MQFSRPLGRHVPVRRSQTIGACQKSHTSKSTWTGIFAFSLASGPEPGRDLLDAGIDVPHSCREGHCGSCVATVVQGEVDMVACDILGPDDLRDGLILACQARPRSVEVRIEF